MNKFLQSEKGKVVMNFVYGFGAAIVILGAMFKIMHWPGASVMIVGGLTTEAIIFAISAFEPPHHELDWTLVYPELAMHAGEGDDHSGSGDHKSKKGGDGLSQELDKMLEEAKIGPELIESLGSGMRIGQTDSQRPQNVEAFGRCPAVLMPMSPGLSTAPIGPG